jgi:integrase
MSGHGSATGDLVRGDRFFALWMLAATTGMRRGELAGLLSTDINFRHATVSPSAPRVSVDGQVQASGTKTEAGKRVMALDPQTLSVLREYVEERAEARRLLGQDSRLLFVWPDGTPLHPDTMTALFGKHLAAAGLPKIRVHDVRHSYATAALRAGSPRRRSASASATPMSPSRCRPTCTSSPAWTRLPPTRSRS